MLPPVGGDALAEVVARIALERVQERRVVAHGAEGRGEVLAAGDEGALAPADGMAISAAYQAIISRDEAAKLTPRYIGEFASDIIDKFEP